VPDDEVRVYRLSKDRLPSMVRSATRESLLATAAVFVLGFASMNTCDPWPFFALCPILMLGTMHLFASRALARRRHARYGLALGPDVLRVVSILSPPMEVAATDIRRIYETRRGLFISNGRSRRLAHVPVGLDGTEEVRAHLGRWRTAEAPPWVPLLRVGFGVACVVRGTCRAAGLPGSQPSEPPCSSVSPSSGSGRSHASPSFPRCCARAHFWESPSW